LAVTARGISRGSASRTRDKTGNTRRRIVIGGPPGGASLLQGSPVRGVRGFAGEVSPLIPDRP
jgi:hypothetical protein